jgi:hypothetical protein
MRQRFVVLGKIMKRIETERGISAFENYASPNLVREIQEKTFYDLDYELQKYVKKPVMKGEVSGPELIEYLHQCRQFLEKYILGRMSGGYSSVRWMYYSRRVPNHALLESDGRLDLYKLQLCDAITGMVASEGSDGVDLLNCPLHEPVLRRAIRFSQEIYWLTSFHSALHRAGKGASLTFEEWAFPTSKCDPVLAGSFSLFDWRIALFNQVPLTWLGTAVHSKASGDRLKSLFAFIGRTPKTTWMRMPESISGIPEPITIRANYAIEVCDFRNLGTLLSDQRLLSPIWDEEATALLALARMTIEMFLIPEFARNLLQVGYVPVKIQDLKEAFSMFYPGARESILATVPGIEVPQNSEGLFQKLAEMRSSSWPLLPGPIIRSCGDIAYVDLASATVRLNHAFKFPRVQGGAANARADHFEDAVQVAVDRSEWADARISAIRGRALRHNGRTITDIDAIGARDRRLLVISCKSILYSEYEDANYKVMRNAADLVQQAVTYWAEKCDLLRNKPVGDNYDFSLYEEIIGVVCTPILVYTPLGKATAEVANGLYAAVSLAELKLWLEGQSLRRPRDSRID